ncbi:MAG: rane protein family [Proteobacteria bacterium]|nr:rane protein family [Pseudomonadota bacterium]
MFCNNCGKDISDNAMSCPSCGTPTSNVSVPNYLVQSILITLCCCLPFGIVAIVYAAQVNGKLAAGDIAGATNSSNSAKMWCWIGLGVGIVVNIIVVIVQVAGVMAANT